MYVLFLNADGTVRYDRKITEGTSGFTGDLDDFDQFGRSLSYLGDLDGELTGRREDQRLGPLGRETPWGPALGGNAHFHASLTPAGQYLACTHHRLVQVQCTYIVRATQLAVARYPGHLQIGAGLRYRHPPKRA